MNKKASVLLMASLGVAAALMVGWRGFRSARGSERARITLLGRRAGLEAKLRELDESRTAAERSLEREAEPAAALPPKAPSHQPTPTPYSQGDIVRNDPKLQVLQLRVKRADSRTSYAALFRTLKLTQEDSEKFLDAMIQYEATVQDLRAVEEMKDGRAANSEALAALGKQAKAELEAAQVAVLGGEGYRQLQDYERTITVRDHVATFAGGAGLAGAPLTSQQAEQLVVLLAEASADYRVGQKFRGTQVDWDAVDRQAQAILSAEQMTLFTRTELSGRWKYLELAAVQAAARAAGEDFQAARAR